MCLPGIKPFWASLRMVSAAGEIAFAISLAIMRQTELATEIGLVSLASKLDPFGK
jgi:hypothetical protein